MFGDDGHMGAMALWGLIGLVVVLGAWQLFARRRKAMRNLTRTRTPDEQSRFRQKDGQ